MRFVQTNYLFVLLEKSDPDLEAEWPLVKGGTWAPGCPSNLLALFQQVGKT